MKPIAMTTRLSALGKACELDRGGDPDFACGVETSVENRKNELVVFICRRACWTTVSEARVRCVHERFCYLYGSLLWQRLYSPDFTITRAVKRRLFIFASFASQEANKPSLQWLSSQ